MASFRIDKITDRFSAGFLVIAILASVSTIIVWTRRETTIEGVFAEIGKEAGSDSIQGAFDELDGLSSEAALGMVSALISSGNHPIGSQVTARGEEVPSGPTPSAAVPPSTKRQRGRPMTVALIVGGVIIVALIKVARRRR